VRHHFGAGHGMSIDSETNGGVSSVSVYDLSIDGTGSGLGGGSSNGIRIKSDASRGGLVANVTYSDACVRGLANPILVTPRYSTATGTLEGYDASHATGIALDNVVVEGITPARVVASNANVTLGPGSVNFTPGGTGVVVNDMTSGASTANACAGKWVTF
jgi:polygalacturonase